MSGVDDPRIVRISVQGTSLFADFDLDDAAPAPTGGFGGWTQQQRGRRRSLVVFTGPDAWAQDIAVSLDAFGDDRADALPRLRKQWQVLRALWSLPAPGASPPLATLIGKLVWNGDDHDTTTNWALAGMAPSQPVLHANDTGELVQWVGVLSFLQLPPRDVLRITTGPRAGARIHVVKAGETLATIARAEHVKASAITMASGAKIRDPRRVKAGDRLRLPARTT